MRTFLAQKLAICFTAIEPDKKSGPIVFVTT